MAVKKVGKKQFKSYTNLDGVSVSEMTKEQLEAHVCQLQQEVEKEKEERNFFQIERDKIQLFWEVTKTQLEEKDALLQLKDSEIDEAALSHLAEIKLYRQKMKHVMFECQQHISEKMKEKMGQKLMIEEEHQSKIHQLESEVNKLKDIIFQLKIDHESAIMDQRLKHGEELCALHEKYLQEIDFLKNKEVEEIGNIRKLLDQSLNEAISEIETQKDTHTEHLIKTHEELIQKIKNYYDNIIKNDVLLINSMQEKIQKSVRMKSCLEESFKALRAENNELSEKLSNLQHLYDKRRLINNDSQNLNSQSIIRNLQRELHGIKKENDFLFIQLQKVKEDKEKNQAIQLENKNEVDSLNFKAIKKPFSVCVCHKLGLSNESK